MRFGELDALGHVNNAVFFRWFEAARARHFTHVGLTDYGPDAPRLVLAHTEAAFRREMRLHEDHVVTVRTTRVGTTSVTQDYAVFAPDLRATGSAVTVFTRGGVKVAVPEEARAALLSLDPPAR